MSYQGERTWDARRIPLPLVPIAIPMPILDASSRLRLVTQYFSNALQQRDHNSSSFLN